MRKFLEPIVILAIFSAIVFYLKQSKPGFFVLHAKLDSNMTEVLPEYNKRLPIEATNAFGLTRLEKVEYIDHTMKFSGQLLEFTKEPEGALFGFKNQLAKEYCRGHLSQAREMNMGVEYNLKFPSHSAGYLPPAVVIGIKPTDCRQ